MIIVEKIKFVCQYDDKDRNKIKLYCKLKPRTLVVIISSIIGSGEQDQTEKKKCKHSKNLFVMNN